MTILRNVARYLVGILFIVSGFVKLVDPIGTKIKLEEYFHVFAADFSSVFEFFIPYALFLSLLLCALEVILGVALLMLYRIRVTIWLLVGIIVFFTILTFYSATTGRVTDCGCFGDAMPLDPWQSFLKDVILSILIGFLVFQMKGFKSIFDTKAGHITIGVTTLLSFAFGIYNVMHEPVIDFRQYKVGNDITALMSNGKGAVYHYKMLKDGKEEVLETYPTDPSYKFVEAIKISEAELPTIHDFKLEDKSGGDATSEVLEGNKLIILTTNVTKFNTDATAGITDLLNMLDSSISPCVITGSGIELFREFNGKVGWNAPVYRIDEVVSKAIARGNPSLILLQNGVIKAKWHHNDMPSAEDVKAALGK